MDITELTKWVVDRGDDLYSIDKQVQFKQKLDKYFKEQCTIPDVVMQREQLINFIKEVIDMYEKYDIGDEDIYRKGKAIIN